MSRISIIKSSFSRGTDNHLVTEHKEEFTWINDSRKIKTGNHVSRKYPCKTDMLYRLQSSPSGLNNRIRVHFSTTKIPGRYSLTLALEVLVSKRVRNRRTRHGTPHHEFPEIPPSPHPPTPFRKQNLYPFHKLGPASCPAQLIISGIYGKWKNV